MFFEIEFKIFLSYFNIFFIIKISIFRSRTKVLIDEMRHTEQEHGNVLGYKEVATVF